MTTWDRFMLSFIFGYVIGSLLARTMVIIWRHEERERIKYMGTKKMSEEEMKNLMKFLGIHEMPDDNEEDTKDD